MAGNNGKNRQRTTVLRSGDDAENDGQMRTLWRASLRIGTNREAFYFREIADFGQAAKTAQKLLEASLSARMVGAEIVAVEREATLWN
jgi:hypothetical protein